ncbi:MAG TPA: hypothetical protein VGF98_01060 [Candidatus Tumulicola sp.]
MIRMLDVLLFVALLARGVAPSPSPQASPLKEITHVTGSLTCIELHDRVAPSESALIQNDATIADGVKILERRAREGGGRPLDTVIFENDGAAIVRNLSKIDDLLRDAPNTMEQLTTELRSVEEAQRAEVKVIEGTNETQGMTRLMYSDTPPDEGMSGNAPSSDLVPLQNVPLHAVADAATQVTRVIRVREQLLMQTLIPLTAQCQGTATAPP